MAREKWIARREHDGAVLGVAWDRAQGVLLMGGPRKWAGTALGVCVVVPWAASGVQRAADGRGGRWRVRVRCDEVHWHRMLATLHEDGWRLERVRSFRRLIN